MNRDGRAAAPKLPPEVPLHRDFEVNCKAYYDRLRLNAVRNGADAGGLGGSASVVGIGTGTRRGDASTPPRPRWRSSI